MSKRFKTISISLIAIFGIGFLLIPSTSAQAQDLEVVFEDEPLFNEANFLPGDSIIRWVEVINNSGETKPIATEAINYPGFSNPDNVPVDDLSRVLLIVIREEGGSDLYGGSSPTGEKTLFNFYEDGEIYLSDIATGNFKKYEFEITFPLEKENEWQEKTTGFDILIGFQGTEGNGGGGGGGGVLPPGLTIFNEADKNIATSSVTITWQTNYFSTSQVIYGTEGESHTLDLSDNTGTPPKYGYEHTTPEYDTVSKVTFHTVEITGLTPGTTYYYRCVSHASLALSTWHTFTTKGVAGEETYEGEEEEEEEVPSEGPGEWIEPGEEDIPEGEVGPIVEGTTAEEKEEPIVILTPEVITGFFPNLLANIGDIFGGLGSTCYPCFPWWVILILAVYPLIESALNQRREKRRAKKWLNWSLGLIILAIIFYLTNYHCVAVWIYLVLALSTLLFWRFINPQGTKYPFITGLLIILILFIIWLILGCLYIWIITIAVLIYLFVVDFLKRREKRE